VRSDLRWRDIGEDCRFGVARKFQFSKSFVQSNFSPGKVHCMAPELFVLAKAPGEKTFDGAAADMWSCGIMLFELCAPKAFKALWKAARPSDSKYRALVKGVESRPPSLKPLIREIPELEHLSAPTKSIMLDLFRTQAPLRMGHEVLKAKVTDRHGPSDSLWVDLPEETAERGALGIQASAMLDSHDFPKRERMPSEKAIGDSDDEEDLLPERQLSNKAIDNSPAGSDDEDLLPSAGSDDEDLLPSRERQLSNKAIDNSPAVSAQFAAGSRQQAGSSPVRFAADGGGAEMPSTLSQKSSGYLRQLLGIKLGAKSPSGKSWSSKLRQANSGKLRELFASMGGTAGEEQEGPAHVAGLRSVLKAAKLANKYEAALNWCVESGVESIEYLREVEMENELVEALQLKPAQRKMLLLKIAQKKMLKTAPAGNAPESSSSGAFTGRI